MMYTKEKGAGSVSQDEEASFLSLICHLIGKGNTVFIAPEKCFRIYI
jgi:hypothetical protein